MVLLTCAVSQELGFWVARPHVEMLVTGVGPVEPGSGLLRDGRVSGGARRGAQTRLRRPAELVAGAAGTGGSGQTQ